MGTQGAEKRGREEDGSMDRISELPEPILHYILCFLSQNEAVQTCVLSKSWRHLGITRPKIEFNGSMFLGSMRGKFMSVFGKTLQRYHDQNLSIHEFVLWVFPMKNPESVAIFENLILMALQKGVKKIDFCFVSVAYTSLPSLIFQTQSLEELYLYECEHLISIDKVLSKHLRTLSLSIVFIAEESLNKIFSSCPLLECVVLDRCKGLTAINVKELRILTHFECHLFSDFDSETLETSIIEFDSQTLETIRIEDYPNWYHHHHKNTYFPRLKTLFLKYVRLPTESLSIFSCNFPSLEELELVSCDGFEQVRLSSPSIQSLTMKVSGDSIKAFIIDAPNMLCFDFSGNWPPTSFSITTTSNDQLKSRIDITCPLGSDDDDDISTWFLLLNEMLKALTQSHISLNFCWFDYPTSPITFCDSYEPVQVENLIANGNLLCSDFGVSLNLLFRTCRPRCITYMYLFVDAKFEWQKKNNNRVDSLCNIFLKEISGETTSERFFWIHDLEEASMESFDEKAKEWRLVQGTSWSECALSNNQSELKIRILLTWRES